MQGKKPKALWEEIRLQDNRVRREVTTAEKAVGHASHSSTATARVEYEVSSTLSDSRCAIWILAVHLRASLLAERIIVLLLPHKLSHDRSGLQACFSSTKAICRLLIHSSSIL